MPPCLRRWNNRCWILQFFDVSQHKSCSMNIEEKPFSHQNSQAILQVKQSCFLCPEENTRERQGHAEMNEKVWLNWSFSHIRLAECYLLQSVVEVPIFALFLKQWNVDLMKIDPKKCRKLLMWKIFTSCQDNIFYQVFFFRVSLCKVACWWLCFAATAGGNETDENFLRENLQKLTSKREMSMKHECSRDVLLGYFSYQEYELLWASPLSDLHRWRCIDSKQEDFDKQMLASVRAE